MMIYDTWHHLLTTFEQTWLDHLNFEMFADAIHDKGGALSNCWGFIDGTVRPICRPGKRQRLVYNGHKKDYAIKFQSIVAPNSLIANLSGPVEGKRHDSAINSGVRFQGGHTLSVAQKNIKYMNS